MKFKILFLFILIKKLKIRIIDYYSIFYWSNRPDVDLERQKGGLKRKKSVQPANVFTPKDLMKFTTVDSKKKKTRKEEEALSKATTILDLFLNPANRNTKF